MRRRGQLKLLLLAVLCAVALKPSLFSHPYDFSRAQNMQIFLSFPRTGTNWTLAGLQFLTHRRVHYINQYPDLQNRPSVHNKLNVNLSMHKPPIYRTHGFPGKTLKQINREKNQLFMIIRDPVETVIRMFKRNRGGIFDAHQFKTSHQEIVKKYVELIRILDRWPEKTRHYFFYEDLLSKPYTIFSQLLDFLKEPAGQLEDFIQNIDHYSTLTRLAYNKQWKNKSAGSLSEGKCLHYHAKAAEQSIIDTITKAIYKECGERLFNKYLRHYFTQQN